ncbi:MAG: hypothetical protein RJB38_1946 [Pseudomonadota bacterium]|jgi:two-component system chemotaxis response regulator CheY
MFGPTTKVLVVDDMLTMRKLVSKTLREIGLTEITEASDGVLAWEAIEKAAPPIELVISDWNMPNCTGMDLLKKIRGSSKHAALPFIMVTAEAEQHQVVEAVKAGVSNYVVKPFTPEALREKLEAVHKKASG